ncbi:MAG: dihydropteroate synthase [Peptococcaceae bacterium]|nr:dihydropteroate synthase [Peptococcaceae bacterium]
MQIGNKYFDFSGATPFIMGILNVTPDSFSDGGRYNTVDAAVQHALDMIKDDCDIIDIGAESTRPGHTQISVDEECSRLLPVLKALKNATDIPLSVDTYRGTTAREALAHGADMINDIWGLLDPDAIAPVVAEAGCPICIMHNRHDTDYSDFVREWLLDMQNRVDRAHIAGITDKQIILDPGIGFAKSFDWDIDCMQHLDDLCALGYPVLLGLSRKRMIGTLSGLPLEERDEPTAAANIHGYLHGARLFRVHNVRLARRTLDTFAQLEVLNHG